MYRPYDSLNAWFMMVYDMYYFYIKRAGFLLYVHESPHDLDPSEIDPIFS